MFALVIIAKIFKDDFNHFYSKHSCKISRAQSCHDYKTEYECSSGIICKSYKLLSMKYDCIWDPCSDTEGKGPCRKNRSNISLPFKEFKSIPGYKITYICEKDHNKLSI